MRCPNGKGFHLQYRKAIKETRMDGKRKSISAKTAVDVLMRKM